MLHDGEIEIHRPGEYGLLRRFHRVVRDLPHFHAVLAGETVEDRLRHVLAQL